MFTSPVVAVSITTFIQRKFAKPQCAFTRQCQSFVKMLIEMFIDRGSCGRKATISSQSLKSKALITPVTQARSLSTEACLTVNVHVVTQAIFNILSRRRAGRAVATQCYKRLEISMGVIEYLFLGAV